MRAIVVFHDRGTGFLSRFLKPGFRHCFVAIRNGNYWIQIDGLLGVPLVEVVAPADFDLTVYCRNKGSTVIETYQRAAAPRSPFAIANCVGLVSAILCIDAPFVFTPYQLYKHLRTEK